MLYIRRRNQLLQDKAKRSDSAYIRGQYLRLRAQVLRIRYGALDRRFQGSKRSSAMHSLRQSMESLVTGDVYLARNCSTGVVPTKSAEASRAMAGDTSLAEHYAFCGMEHIFEKQACSVVAVQFSNRDKTHLACACQNGTLSVFSLANNPPTLECTLKGHKGPVNDFDWSASNDFIVSASSDGTCRLWRTSTGACLREIVDSSTVKTLCCKFHPHNNNLLVIGNSKAQVRIFNVSTGMAIKDGSSKTAGAVLCLTFDSTGTHLWAGDNKGSMYLFQLNYVTGKLQRLNRIVVSTAGMITSISYRTWINREASDPSILVSCTDGFLRLFRIHTDGNLFMKRKFTVKHTSQPIRSAFCPLMSFLQGACVVTGGEDANVYFFDTETGVVVNRLQGHSSPVLCVCWAYDESLLASCDLQGIIIMWKRCVPDPKDLKLPVQ